MSQYGNLQPVDDAYEELQERFFIAVEDGDVDTVDTIITEEKVDPNMKERERATYAIIEASRQGHLPIVRLLLEKGADINAQGLQKETALMAAVQKGHSDVVRFLVEKGADKTLQNARGKTALYLADSVYLPNNANGLPKRIQELKNILQAGGRTTHTKRSRQRRQKTQKRQKRQKRQKTQKTQKRQKTQTRSRRN